MTELQRYHTIAAQLAQEDPNPIVLPITRTGRMYDRPWGYICNDNGSGCGKAFKDRASKNRHRQWCQKVGG